MKTELDDTIENCKIKQLKSGKVAGINGVPPECRKMEVQLSIESSTRGFCQLSGAGYTSVVVDCFVQEQRRKWSSLSQLNIFHIAVEQACIVHCRSSNF